MCIHTCTKPADRHPPVVDGQGLVSIGGGQLVLKEEDLHQHHLEDDQTDHQADGQPGGGRGKEGRRGGSKGHVSDVRKRQPNKASLALCGGLTR